MKSLIPVVVLFLSSIDSRAQELPNRAGPSIPDAWKEKPQKIQVDLGDLKIGAIGYRIESTDFEADPNRQLVVTLEGNGNGMDIIEIWGRYSNRIEIEEWTVHYHDGSPLFAQLKKWKKVLIAGEELGEALSKIKTFLAKDGKFTIPGKNGAERIMDMTAFAESSQAQQPGTGQPAARPEPEPEGGDKPQPESEGRSR
jgi:hypothetical protein